MRGSHTMKTLALVLLVALLCTETAQGLKCYQCIAASNMNSCHPAVCSFPDGVCVSQEVTTIVESEKVSLENKFCLPSCPDRIDIQDMHTLGLVVSSKTSCCKGDLCNAGVLAVGSAWVLSGGLLLSLGLVLLCPGL
ncbi:lymphocyte antigen 6A-2/6E-1-like [Cynocephalus volans]|uniref:lymphocyte antigen 6A-2/6E-1-like n=1 Tax=Cynocephalus volans TaxID=110931 RepID=UPI002FC813C1